MVASILLKGGILLIVQVPFPPLAPGMTEPVLSPVFRPRWIELATYMKSGLIVVYFDNECFVFLIRTVLDNLDLQLSREVEWRNYLFWCCCCKTWTVDIQVVRISIWKGYYRAACPYIHPLVSLTAQLKPDVSILWHIRCHLRVDQRYHDDEQIRVSDASAWSQTSQMR